MSGNYTEDELNEAIAKAVDLALAPFQEEAALDNLSKAFDDVKAPLVAKIEELQNTVDTATLRADTAESNYNALVTMLEEAQATQDAAAEAASRREARREAVKDLAFTPEFVEERLDRWVALSDEAFESLLEGWKAVASTATVDDKNTSDDGTIPASTAMTAARVDNNKGTARSERQELASLQLRGGDIRNL